MMVEGNVDRGKSWWWAFISVLGTLELEIYKERDQEIFIRYQVPILPCKYLGF